jgi:Tfp pilus assembly protein PilO
VGVTALNRLEWEAAKWAKHLGVSGLAGLVLMMLASAVFLGLILPSKAKLIRATGEAVDLQNRHNVELANPASRALPVESSLILFYKQLPPEQSATKQMKKIYKLASGESLRLTQGEYKFTRDKDGHLGSYQIILPVKGNYLQVKKFIAKVMNAMPMVALDGVSFRRETIGGNDVEAKIQFTIFLGAA